MRSLKRFYIIGTSGSGKTTLAKLLSKKLNSLHVDLDLIRYPEGSKLEGKALDKVVQKIADRDTWVAEGVYLHWVTKLLENADKIIWLDLPMRIPLIRVTKRYVKQRIKGEEKRGFKNFLGLDREIYRHYHREGTELTEKDGAISPKIIEKTLKAYKDKLVRIRSNKDLDDFIQSV